MSVQINLYISQVNIYLIYHMIYVILKILIDS